MTTIENAAKTLEAEANKRGFLSFQEAVTIVVKAMRDPSPRMLKAACAAMSPGKRPTEKRVGVKAKHGIRYRAMIDSILTEAETREGN